MWFANILIGCVVKNTLDQSWHFWAGFSRALSRELQCIPATVIKPCLDSTWRSILLREKKTHCAAVLDENCWISYFPVTEYSDQEQLLGEKVCFWLIVPEGIKFITSGKDSVSHEEILALGSWLIAFHPHTVSRRRRQKVGSYAKTQSLRLKVL